MGQAKPKRRNALQTRAAAIFERLSAQAPEPKTELEYVNPYTLLVAVVLSAQATDAGVNKAKNVIALSRALIDHHGGRAPREREALEALPGVGRKTANVVLNVAFGEPTIAVDTHVFRVANRLGIAPGKTPREVEDGLMQVIPLRYLPHAHHWLILHGRYTCKARAPECGRCVINDLCPWEGKTA